MVNDMIIRFEDFYLNLGEIVYVEDLKEDGLKIEFKNGQIKLFKVSEKTAENIKSYFNSLCPNINDDYTRNMMVQSIVSQRQQFVSRMMTENSRGPQSDFPDRMVRKTDNGFKGPEL